MQSVHRLFVALVPPAAVAGGVTSLVDEAGLKLPPHRRGEARGLHLTLAFIGETRAKGVLAVKESVDRSSAGLAAFDLRVERLMTVPTATDGGPARLLAAVTDSPATLLEVHRRLAIRLVKPKKNGRRPRFLPHLTLARFDAGKTCEAIDIDVRSAGLGWRVSEVLLMSSRVSSCGSVYEVIHRAELV